MTHVTAYWWDDGDEWAFVESVVGDTEDSSDTFDGDIPDDLWAHREAMFRDLEVVDRQIVDLLGLDPAATRKAQPCAEWDGDEASDGFPEWWTITITASDGTEWPLRSTIVGFHQPTRDAAEEYLASLPDEFYLLAPGPRPLSITKDRLAVEHHPAIPGREYDCNRCGWSRAHHAGAAGEGAAE